MANCYGCPYRWHDSDCEYCSKRNDEIIDLKSYSKETCSYYKQYMASKGSSSSSSSSSSDDGCCAGGCLFFLFGLPIIIFILSVILTLVLNAFGIEFYLITWIFDTIAGLFNV